MSDKFTVKDVTEDLGKLLHLTSYFGIDEEGFWTVAETGERFIYKMDKTDDGKPIVNFKDPLPKGDFYFFNPFAEGLGRKSVASKEYYRAIRVALSAKIMEAMTLVTMTVAASKEDADLRIPPAVLRIASVPVDTKKTFLDVVDDKTADEFEAIFNRLPDGIIQVPYLAAQMTAKVKCDVFTDPTWEEKFTKGVMLDGKDVRKKSVAAFRALLLGVLGLKTPEDISELDEKYDPALKSAPALHATLMVYLKLYSRFNDVLSEESAINLGLIQEVIDRLPLAYAVAKHMHAPTAPKESPTATTTADTRGYSVPAIENRPRFSGPPVVDSYGRRVDTAPAAGQMPGGYRGGPGSIAAPAADPFAPAVRPAAGSFGGFSSGFSGGFGIQHPQTSGFTPQPQFGGGGYAPSNFGSPGTSTNYFR